MSAHINSQALPMITPILRDLRSLYDISDRMERFKAYVELFTGTSKGEPFPIGNFSPMGRRQMDYEVPHFSGQPEFITRG